MVSVINLILEVLWLMLPACGANIIPGFFKNTLRFLGKPADFGKSWKGKRILGDNKTFRGFIVGILFAIILALLQTKIYVYSAFFKSISIVDYSKINYLTFGFLLGFGALFGDAVKSFFKRRADIAPGKRWLPFDYIDWEAGSIIFMSFIYVPNMKHVAAIFLIFTALHVAANYIAFCLKLKDQKW